MTVSKTTTQEAFRETDERSLCEAWKADGYMKIADDKQYGDIRAAIVDTWIEQGSPAPKENWLYARLVESRSLTAELQKENAELRKALNWAMRDIRKPSRIRGQNDSHCDAYEKAAALSKEKAK